MAENWGQTTANPYANREGVTNVPDPSQPTASTVSPAVSYTPGGVARAPGFYNPYNPHDTGYHNQQNAELNNGVGGKVSWWDYDKEAPIAGAVLNSEGYYGGGPGGGGGGGGISDFNPEGVPLYGQAKSNLLAQSEAEKAAGITSIRQALVQFGLIPATGFEDKWGALDATTKNLAQTNTDTGISTYARLLEGKNDSIKALLADLNAKGLRRSGAKGYQLRRRQLDFDRNFQDSLSALLGRIGGIYNTYTQNEYSRQQSLFNLLAQIYSQYYNPYANSGGGSSSPSTGGSSQTYYNSQAGASPYQPQSDGYYTGGALYATPAEHEDINPIFYFK